jgi:hypothetical protein
MAQGNIGNLRLRVPTGSPKRVLTGWKVPQVARHHVAEQPRDELELAPVAAGAVTPAEGVREEVGPGVQGAVADELGRGVGDEYEALVFSPSGSILTEAALRFVGKVDDISG